MHFHTNIKKIVTCALAAVMVSGMLAGCGQSKIDGTQTLITVNGESEDLGVGSFLAKYQQASIYKYWGTYFGSSGELFDTVYDSSTSETYGDTLKDSVIEDLKLMLCMRQHAEDYNVSLTDEETAAIEEAAQAYIDNNDEKVRNMIGASKDDVIEAMTLQTIQSKMMDPIVADVDTTVDDADVQQTSVTYVTVSIPDSSSDTDSSADSSAADETTSGTDSSASSTSESAENVESKVSALEEAQEVLDAVAAEDDVANADMNTIASGIDSDLAAYSGRFTTNDPTDTTLDSAVVEAVSGLEDGTLVDHVVEGADGDAYYVVRLDQNFDEDGTESKRNSEIIQRKQDAYDEITEGWVDEATVEVNEEAWATVVLSDSDPITLADSTAESAASSAESASESTSSTDSSSVSAAESAASADSSSVSAAESAASADSSSVSAAESTASAAEETASSAA